jgi:hypothetical protein
LQSVLLSEAHVNQLKNWIVNRTNIASKEVSSKTLKYQATKDGFEALKFHEKCDGITRLLVVVKNKNNYIFGGFTTVAFHSTSNAYVASTDKASFLFSLINPHSIQPTMFPIHNESTTIYSRKDYGATFGGGHDLHIANNSNTVAGSYSGLGHSYTDNSDKKNNFFNGQRDLGLISEILAFAV